MKTYRRQKREWIKFAAACREEEDNSKRNPIARIRSDCEETQPIIYRISGEGIDQHPFGIFVINQKTGEINITKIVDREANPIFTIICHAVNPVTGQSVENPLMLRVRVLDINDNHPVFTQTMFAGSIVESSMENTLVMKITATDADEPNNLNSKIAYKILSQTPGGPPKFILNAANGELHIANILDREEAGQYSLVVQATDRDGGPDGISSECLCQVTVEDVNDNFPVLSQSSYSVTIIENSLSPELLRIKVEDADLAMSDNWFAEFFFISGNENNHFEIVLDQGTNEGILRVVKEIDYEQFSSIPLSIGVRNIAPFHYSVASQYQAHGTPIVVQINNVIEGPGFDPTTITVTASEGLTSETIHTYKVGQFQAIDRDTGRVATNVRYQMGHDPAAWFNANPTTAEITFSKVIDRESIYVVNGVYKAEILAISKDSPYKTATGTIVLTIEDVNDNCPFVTDEIRRVCMDNPSVVITAKDLDDHPYGPPFKFTIVAQSPGSTWNIRIVNVVPILMSQSNCCGYCRSRPVGGVGAGFEPVPECTEGAIHSWGIEGAQPEDRDVSNICGPGAIKGDFGDSSDIYTTKYDGGMVSREETTGLGAVKGYVPTVGYETTTGYGTTGRTKETFGGTIKEYRESGVNMAFLDSYFSEKAFAYADEDEGRPANDCLLIYDHEGIGTPVGSIGCCSFIGDDLDDTYLDTLGPKFKTLAEICLGIEIEPFPDPNTPWPALPNPEIDLNLPPPGTTIVVNTSSSVPPPTNIGSTTVVTENAYTSTSSVQPPRPVPDPMFHGNVVVTETYTSGSTLKPPTLNMDPMHGSNVVVTERVLAPAPVTDLHGMIDIPDLPGGSNVVVTERVIAPNARIPPSMTIPDLSEGSNVVVTERVIRPATNVQGNLSIPPEFSGAHNVVVTERVMSGAGMSSGVGNMSMVSGTGISGVGGLGPMLSPDNLLSQTVGSASPATTRRRVTKYSTIQYSNQ
ncbi:desmoglein-1-like [Sceloporus undulatus]|uniref:desmoglein-1-like n=1 Tax=Sceloporus undulatus TaxID=8520 RepID=UPI001C4B2FB6|nr:desmoglein-1-like [Sceloporus undulatus]